MEMNCKVGGRSLNPHAGHQAGLHCHYRKAPGARLIVDNAKNCTTQADDFVILKTHAGTYLCKISAANARY
jgi:hypothetical protein